MSTVVPFPARAVSRPAAVPRAPDPAGLLPPALLWGMCPWSEDLTDYDRRNIPVFARLLHDESEGATEEDLALGVFRLDPSRDRRRALDVVRSHMKRAHWIADRLLPASGLVS